MTDKEFDEWFDDNWDKEDLSMEKLALIAAIVKLAVIGCVSYTVWSVFTWFLSLLGGICIGC